MASADDSSTRFWDGQAVRFDEPPDHGLTDPSVRSAWKDLLQDVLPALPASVLDAGCGTGSLSLLMAEMGYSVKGFDFSARMVNAARSKVAEAGLAIEFLVMDAETPALASSNFDAIVCRHVLWALREPARVLEKWATLLAPTGRLVLIEGFWATGVGMHSENVVAALPPGFHPNIVQTLDDKSALWGGSVTDERFMVVAAAT